MARLVSLWSGPRCRSTAVMYSVAQRSDVEVVDEPLFGHYLSISGAARPSRTEVLAAQATDPVELVPALQPGPRVRFFKHMANHLRGWNPDVFAEHSHVLLVRDPVALLASYRQEVERPTLEDVGLAWQAWWWDHCRRSGWPVYVLDSDRLAADPEAGLRALCRVCGWDWDERMLRWAPGPRVEDGVWAKYWYASVHASTGWTPQPVRPAPACRPEDEALLAACAPHFAALRAHAIN